MLNKDGIGKKLIFPVFLSFRMDILMLDPQESVSECEIKSAKLIDESFEKNLYRDPNIYVDELIS